MSKFYILLNIILFCFSMIEPPHAHGGPVPSVEERIFKVGVYENSPKVFTDNSGTVTGIFPDLLEIIAELEGWQLEYVHCSWHECLSKLTGNELDVLGDIASSKEREEKFLFTKESVFLNWGTIYTRKDFTIKTLLELDKKTIATVRSDIHTIGENGIEALVSKFELSSHFVYVDGYREALELLQNGSVDAAVVNRLFGTVSEKDFDIRRSPIVFNPVHLKFAFPKNERYREVAAAIDRHLQQFKNRPESIFHKVVNAYLLGTRFQREMNSFQLTQGEREWLSRHQTLRLGVDKTYAPYSFRGEDGSYQGLAVDIVNLLASHLGIEVEIIDGLGWLQILDAAKTKTLDAVLTVVDTAERRKYLKFTDIYLPTPLMIVTQSDYLEIEGPEDLQEKRVALVRGYSSAEQALKEHPDIIPLMVETPLDGLAAVSAGKADCYIGVLGVNEYTAKVNGLSNLKIAARYNMLLNGQRIGVRSDWPELATILDKALSAISEKKRIELFQEWISSAENLDGPVFLQEKNSLTAEETQWVKEHRKIVLGVDPEFAPFEFLDKNGKYKGIASEYLEILQQRLGLTFEVMPGLSWDEAVEGARVGAVDLLPCVGKTRSREDFLIFSSPYLNFQRVTITRDDTPFISCLDDIKEMKVAVQSNSSHEGFLREKTCIGVSPYKTLKQTLQAVSEGNAEAMVGNLSSAIYWIRKENFTNLKVAAPVGYGSEHLSFGVRRDWPQLANILEKGLASLSPLKEKEIRERWINVDYKTVGDPGRYIKYLLQGGAAVALMFACFLIWNYRLKQEIAKRTLDLQQANQRLLDEIETREKAEEEKKKIQAQLFQTQKMESLGSLAGGIAHDFNNLLTIILGYAEITTLKCTCRQEVAEGLDKLMEAGGRAKELVQQILTFSRQVVTEPQPVKVGEIAEETLQMLRHTLPATIEIVTDMKAEDACVFADPTQISQIFMNLCTNAYHAMEESGGILTVTILGSVCLPPDLANNLVKKSQQEYIKVSVSDTGSGIPEEARDRIFDPYFTTKAMNEGTGIGLSIVQGIVKNCGGSIRFTTRLGEGTTFDVYLPICSESIAKVTTSQENIVGGRERILLIDDETSIVEMYREILETLGYSVTIDDNPLHGLQAFRSNPGGFDLVITDQTMPGMTGTQLAVKILDIRPDIPIILYSGYSSLVDQEKAEEIGISAFAMKPIDRTTIGALIHSVFEKKRNEL